MSSNESNRIEKLLALLLIRSMADATQGEKAMQLNLAGFTSVEIANILGTTSAVVQQRLYEARKKKPKRASR